MSEKAILGRIKKLQDIPGNERCTDCYSSDVSWAVMNLGFFVCVECAGVHRGLGVQYSQVRSTELDVGCWDEKVFQYFAAKGNAAARQKYAHDVPRFVLTPRECKTSLVRRNWISKKYREMVYLNRSKEEQKCASSAVSGVDGKAPWQVLKIQQPSRGEME